MKTRLRLSPVMACGCVVLSLTLSWRAATMVAAQAGPSSVQGPPQRGVSQSSEYQGAVDAALEEYKAGHYEEARGLFEHAHRLEPSARTLRGLGMVEFELRHYVRAVELLSQALDSSQKPLSNEQRTAVHELLARTRHFVARYRIELVPAAADVTIKLDNTSTELHHGSAFAVTVGEHRLHLSGAGYADNALHLDAKGGEERTLRVELKRLETPKCAQRS